MLCWICLKGCNSQWWPLLQRSWDDRAEEPEERKESSYQNNDHELQGSKLQESLFRELTVMGGCHEALGGQRLLVDLQEQPLQSARAVHPHVQAAEQQSSLTQRVSPDWADQAGKGDLRKVKSQLHLKLVRNVKHKWKNAIGTSAAKEKHGNWGLLLNGACSLIMNDMEKVEVLNICFALFWQVSLSLYCQSQISMPSSTVR